MNYLMQKFAREIRKAQKDSGTFKKIKDGKRIGHAEGRKISITIYRIKSRFANKKQKMAKKSRRRNRK